MIRIETEKLNVMKQTLEVKLRHYMDQKIALLREKTATSAREESQLSTLQPVVQPYDWRYPSRVTPATFIPGHGSWNVNSSGESGIKK